MTTNVLLGIAHAGLFAAVVLLFCAARGNARRHFRACLSALLLQVLSTVLASVGLLTSASASVDKWVLMFAIDVVYAIFILLRLAFLAGIVDKRIDRR